MKRGRERKGREGKGRIGSRRRIGGCAAYIMTERVKDQGSERLQGWFKWKNQRSLPETSDRPDAEQKGGVKVFSVLAQIWNRQSPLSEEIKPSRRARSNL